MSVDVFCKHYGLGRTRAYEEIAAGRLKARKLGRRTLIAADDAEDWLGHLPMFQEAVDASPLGTRVPAEVRWSEPAQSLPPTSQPRQIDLISTADTARRSAARAQPVASEEEISG
jgi:hypothetical protein